jgi:tetratricopeptide (TPR) repeat protein
MERRSLFSLAPCVVMIVSCVGVPKVDGTGDVSFELYDISSYRLAEEQLEISPKAVLSLPEPSLTVPKTPSVSLEIMDAPVSGIRAQRVLGLPLPPVLASRAQAGSGPAVPQTNAAEQTQTGKGTQTSMDGSGAAAARTSTVDAAPVTRQESAAAARAPAVTRAPAAAVGQAVSANAASASSQALDAPTPASDAASRMRAIYARVGDEVEIGLDGEGFVFLGFPDKAQASGMSFQSKSTREEKTYFKFKAFTLGTYNLSFQRQDNANGRILGETVWVRVVSDNEFQTAVEQQVAQTAFSIEENPDYAYAQRLADLGKYEAALKEYLKGYSESNSMVNDRIASLYFRLGRLDDSEKYYRKNLSPVGAYTESSVIGLVKIAVERKDTAGFLFYLKPFLAVKKADIGDTLVVGAWFMSAAGEIAVGLELLREYASRYPDGVMRDEVDFMTAQQLEADSPQRDISKARDLYRRVVEKFPESRFAGQAKDRLRYIEQHFYYVR